MSNIFFKTNCFLLVTILVMLKFPISVNTGGGSSGLEMDSCFCDKLMEFEENLNYKIFIEGDNMKDIIVKVRKHVDTLQKRIQNEIPGRIQITSLDPAVNGSKTTRAQKEFESLHFYDRCFIDTVNNFFVYEDESSAKELGGLENVEAPNKGQFERYKQLKFTMTFTVPSMTYYKNNSRIPYEYVDNTNFIKNLDFWVVINQFRRPNMSGYDVFFTIDPDFFKEVDAIRKSRSDPTFSTLDPDMLDNTMFGVLKRNGGKFTMSKYYGNYIDVTICNNVMIFYSKVITMMTRRPLTPYIGGRAEGCLRDDGMNAMVTESPDIIGSMTPRKVEEELTVMDMFSHETQREVVTMMLSGFNGLKSQVHEYELEMPDSDDIYYQMQLTYLYIILTVIKNESKLELYSEFRRKKNNRNMNIITNFNDATTRKLYLRNQVLVGYIQVIRVFMRYYFSESAIRNSILVIDVDRDFKGEPPLWYLIMSEISIYMLQVEQTQNDSGGYHDLFDFIQTDEQQIIDMINNFALKYQGSVNFNLRIENLIKHYGDRKNETTVINRNYAVISLMLVVIDFLFWDKGLLSEESYKNFTDLYQAMDSVKIPTISNHFVFSRHFILAPISEEFDELGQLSFIDHEALLNQDDQIEVIEVKGRVKSGRNQIQLQMEDPERVKPKKNSGSFTVENMEPLTITGDNSIAITQGSRKVEINFPKMGDQADVGNFIELQRLKKSQLDNVYLKESARKKKTVIEDQNLSLVNMLELERVDLSGKKTLEILDDQTIVEKDAKLEREQRKEALLEFIKQLNIKIDLINQAHKEHNDQLQAEYTSLKREYDQKVKDQKRHKNIQIPPVPQKPELLVIYKLVRYEDFDIDLDSVNIDNPGALIMKQISRSEDANKFKDLNMLFGVREHNLETEFQNERAMSEQSLIQSVHGAIDGRLSEMKAKRMGMRAQLAEMDTQFSQYLHEIKILDDEAEKELLRQKELERVAFEQEQQRLRDQKIKEERELAIQMQKIQEQKERYELTMSVKKHLDGAQSRFSGIYSDTVEYLKSQKYGFAAVYSQVRNSNTALMLDLIFTRRLSNSQPGSWENAFMFEMNQVLGNDVLHMHEIPISDTQDYNRRLARLMIMSTLLTPTEQNSNYMDSAARIAFYKSKKPVNDKDFKEPVPSNLNTMEKSVAYQIKKIRYWVLEEVRMFMDTMVTSLNSSSEISVFDDYALLIDEDYHGILYYTINPRILDDISEFDTNFYIDLQILLRMLTIKFDMLVHEKTKFSIRSNGEDFVVERDLSGMFGQMCNYPAFLEEAKRIEAKIRKDRQDALIAKEQRELELRRIEEDRLRQEKIALQKEQERLQKIRDEENLKIKLAQEQYEREQAQIEINRKINEEAKQRKIKEAKQKEQEELLRIKQENDFAIHRIEVVTHKSQANTQLLDGYSEQTKILREKVDHDTQMKTRLVQTTQTYELPTIVQTKFTTKVNSPADYRTLMDPNQYMSAFGLESKDMEVNSISTTRSSGMKTRVKVNNVQTLNGGDNVSIRTTTGYVVGDMQQVKMEAKRISSQSKTTEVKRLTTTHNIIDQRNASILGDYKVFGELNTPDVGATKSKASRVRIHTVVQDFRRRMRVRRNLLV